MHLLERPHGDQLGLIDDLEISTVNELFIQTQPAYLQKIQGTELGADERNVARALPAQPSGQRPAHRDGIRLIVL